MAKKIFKWTLAAAALSLFVLIVSGGCCSPNVKNSYLSPEAKDVQAWKIELIEDAAGTSDSTLAELRADIKSKYTKKEYCEPYLKEIVRNLNTLGYHIVEGSVTEGTIRIDIRGRKEHFWLIYLSRDKDGKEEVEWDTRGDPTEGYFSGEEVIIDAGKALQNDEIRAVELEFIALSGKSMGQASLSGCEKIMPNFVVKVIDKMIQQGKY